MSTNYFTGPGTTPDSVKHCLESLRRFLSPYYAVVAVDSKTLLQDPWDAKTSLLVLPGGADLPVCKLLNGEGNSIITKFVRKGGKFIGFCAGGYYGSARCEFEVGNPILEVSGARELKFFPGTARGGAYSGFQYGNEEGARLARINVNKEFLNIDLDLSYHYYNGGPVFVDAENYDNVTILGTYADEPTVQYGKIPASAVHCKVGNGAAILIGSHPEYVPELMIHETNSTEYLNILKGLKEHNESRQLFLRACLQSLGLKVNENELVRPRLTPLMLSSPVNGVVTKIMDDIISNVGLSGEGNNIIKGNQDIFRLHKGEEATSSHQLNKQEEFEDPDTAIKELYAFTDGLPDRKITPYFDIRQYFRILQESYGSLTGKEAGSTLLYGEIITSTSVILDKNFNVLTNVPSGLVCSATVQVSGRGRGGNIWINPPGVIASSLVLDLPIAYKHAPVVFVQYLTSIAVIEAVKNLGEGYDELPIRLKWPNDIYAMKPEYFGKDISNISDEATYVKICGILVNTNVFKNNYKLVIGTGVNLSNAEPTTSINSTISLFNEFRLKQGKEKLDLISPEVLMGKYMYYMGTLFEKFKREGFRPLLPLYYKHWFHTNQIVHLRDHGNARTRITGITEDFGLLAVEEVDLNNKPTGQKFHLQPDGNSFDMFSGLISKKANV